MRGDSVEIVIDIGGATRTYVMQATRAGRRVEVTQARGTIEVAEVTRSGTPIRTARFMTGRVVALVEHPAGETAAHATAAAPPVGGRALTPAGGR
ncbi:MAG TPA: hypothetical protein VE442_15070 [Jatrophihabitans sp.]|jgi:hypothetical protein|nr:hypothetical protein [Jatrophihabitans sp.]